MVKAAATGAPTALPIDKPVVCPKIIGRNDEILLLERALGQARGGHGQTVLIAGEAGIGKSRLVAEVRARAAGRGFLCLQGQCFEPDAALPYAPLVDLLRVHMTGLPPETLASNLGFAAPELGRLIPELVGLLPSLAPPPAPVEPQQEKQRLNQALTHFILEHPGARQRLVIVEDLHWSDETSLEFLLSLARRVTAHPLLLVLTYRSDEISPSLRHFLAELDRGRLARELDLKPLTRGGVGAMLRAIFGPGQPVRADFVEALATLTDGNPFFVEEVLKSLAVMGNLSGSESAGTGQRLDSLRAPRSVEDTVLRRLGRISPPAQWVLTLAAVAGSRFDFSLLHVIAGQDEPRLLRHIKELVAAQLVVEESADRFAFRHALTRRAIYGQLLLRERQALHQAIADAYEQIYAGSAEAHLPDLAYHTFEAGLWEKALTYARRLGEQALAVNAPQAAIEQFTRAIQAVRQLGQPPVPALHRARGQAYEVQGEFQRAHDDYTRALDAARTAGDPVAEWQGLLDLGFLWLARDFERAGDLFQQARDLASRIEDPQYLARSLNRLGNWHANMNQPRQAHVLHRQALDAFMEVDNQPGIAESLDLMGVTSFIAGDRRGAIANLEEAGRRFRLLGDRRSLASILPTLGHLRCSSRVCDTLPGATHSAEQAAGECEEALTIAREIGWRAGEAYALCELAACLSAGGEYGRALTAAREGLAVAAEIGHREWLAIAHSVQGHVYLDLLAPRAALRHCERAYACAREAGVRHLIGLTAAFLAGAHLLGQEPAHARAVLRDLVAGESAVETHTQSVLLAAYADLSLVGGEPDQALRIADRLIAWAELSGGAGIVPRLWKLRGEALAALGRTAEAAAVLEAAREAARDQGARSLLWQFHASLGTLLQSQGHGDAAEQEYAAARALIEELGATAPDDAVCAMFRRSALARVASSRLPSPRRASRNRHGGLTTRECEVVALIARGLSNREIAEALVISERTVEAHTSHIRDKLGHTSRTQAAAWAVEHGLVQHAPR